MKKENVILFIVMFFCLHSYSQKRLSQVSCGDIRVAGDCHSAIQIDPIGEIVFKCAPRDYGKDLELDSNSSKSIYFFEKEHNTIWLKFKTPYNALLTFKIIPIDSTYDYDFLLFPTDTTGFCKRCAEKNVKPIRTNISRNKISEGGITGLEFNSKHAFVHSGPGDIFSAGIQVKKEDEFYLLIDNVYGGNKGFSILFNYYRTKEIFGKVIDKKTGNPIKAQVSIEDVSYVKMLASTQSNKETGEFKLVFPFEVTQSQKKYNVIVDAENRFFSEKIIYSTDLKKSVEKPVNIELQEIKKGVKVKLHNINFHGDSYVHLPQSKPTMVRLYMFMKKYPKLKILIEGHTNGCGKGTGFSQKLSDNRAGAVKKFLVSMGIDETRIQCKGYNCSRMLYKGVITSREAMLNRRVEILVLDY